MNESELGYLWPQALTNEVQGIASVSRLDISIASSYIMIDKVVKYVCNIIAIDTRMTYYIVASSKARY